MKALLAFHPQDDHRRHFKRDPLLFPSWGIPWNPFIFTWKEAQVWGGPQSCGAGSRLGVCSRQPLWGPGPRLVGTGGGAEPDEDACGDFMALF